LTAEYIDGAERTPFLLLVLSGQAKGRDWCDDRRTEQRFETCATLAAEALDATATRLAADSGRDIAGLRWGDAHVAVSEHRPMSNAGPFARFFELRTPFPGDTYTVNVGALSHREGAPFSTRHGPSLRAIHDLNALDTASVWVQSTGQSGSPFSEQYADMQPLWRDVAYLPMRPAHGRGTMALDLLPK
jgi:penicillin amidase